MSELGATAAARVPADDVARRARVALLVSVGVTLALYYVPYIRFLGYPLMLLSTLAHETGHGVAALLVGGNFDALRIYSDGSGLAPVSGFSGRFARAFVSAGGLVGPACASAVAFFAAKRPRVARAFLAGLGALLVLALIVVVRSLFGWLFVGLLAASLLALGVRARPSWNQIVLVFLAVQLALSVFSRGDYLFTDVAQTGGGTFPSDVANMSSALFLPYWFWGALCGALSLAVLGLGLWSFLRTAVTIRASGLAPNRNESHP